MSTTKTGEETDSILKEAKRLYDLGAAVIWLRERSKRPVEYNWTSGPRKTWDELMNTYRPGYNVGVRLGAASKIGKKYLAVGDLDIKSKEPHHKKEAEKAFKKFLAGHDCPIVNSGRGGGSAHAYFVTDKPFRTFNYVESPDTVKVLMPSKVRISKREKKELTKDEIKRGVRLSRAWEISLYSEGRQVVLPPSVHPDSGRVYAWRESLGVASDLPCLTLDEIGVSQSTVDGQNQQKKSRLRSSEKMADANFINWKPTNVRLEQLDIPKSVVQLIIEGIWRKKMIENRSDYLPVACKALLRHGLNKNDILTILTEHKYFLGECALDHVQTDNRQTAARWVWRYTLAKVIEQDDIRKRFLDDPMTADMEEADAKKQDTETTKELSWSSLLDRTEGGNLKSTLYNCKLLLEHACEVPALVGRDEFAANDFYLSNSPWRSKKGKPITDVDIHRIKFWLVENWGVEFTDHDIDLSLREIADQNRYHPVQNWLRGLVWDGTERISTWLKDYAGAEGPDAYLQAVSRKVLIAMVKRVFEPGCKFDHVAILEGLQGIGKSTLLKNLAGEEWFSDAKLDIGDKDAVMLMQSKWLIELGELSVMRKAEIEELKAFITQTTDRIRVPYGKRTEDFPRQCIFIGSTNNEEYLADMTGNRRFWPVALTGDVRHSDIAGVRDQLFAEALQAYEWGETVYLDDPKVAALALFEQNKRQQSDEWIGLVGDILESEGFPTGSFEIKEVAKRMKLGVTASQNDYKRIGHCLRLLGFKPTRETTGKRRQLWSKKR